MPKSLGQLSGWVDYDRSDLSALSLAVRVDYFEKRVKLVLIRPLKRLLENELYLPDSSALLIFAVSLCSAIDATGKFLTGGTMGNGDRFREFIKRYMHPDYYSKDLHGITYVEILWRYFRNGLAHGFAVCHGGFEANGPYFSIKNISGYDCLMVDPSLLYEDFSHGFENYLSDLRGAPVGADLLNKFDSVFEDVFINGK